MLSDIDLVGRERSVFADDLEANSALLVDRLKDARVLVIGAAGSVGQAVTLEILKRQPRALHAVDLSENNLVELVRDFRSSIGSIPGDFLTFAIDAGSSEFQDLLKYQDTYDIVLNLSAMKHVRSEKDPYSLTRMIRTNVIDAVSCIGAVQRKGTSKYFAVSSDKAANPANAMGASKQIMEMCLNSIAETMVFSTARFANVAYSDGSLTYGFRKRIEKRQPISAPYDIKRYFVSGQEAGQLCLMSAILGEDREVFFPNFDARYNLVSFSDLAEKFLHASGYKPFYCNSEQEARDFLLTSSDRGQWPVYFFQSDTTGEKPYEEFYTVKESPSFRKFASIGVLLSQRTDGVAEAFVADFDEILRGGVPPKPVLIELLQRYCPTFQHVETEKNLDGKM